MRKRTFEFSLRFAQLAAGTAVVSGCGPFRPWLSGSRPVIVRPEVAMHGGGGCGGHGPGGQGSIGAGPPGYPGSPGGGGDLGWRGVLALLALLVGYVTVMVLGIKHELMALAVIGIVVFGVPIALIGLLLLLLPVVSLLSGRGRLSGDHLA